MAIKRKMDDAQLRLALNAKFWAIAKNEIGEQFAFEIAESLYPEKICSLTHRGLSGCTIEEYRDIVNALKKFAQGRGGKKVGQGRQVGPVRPVGQKKNEKKNKPTGKPVPVLEWSLPATGKQIELIHKLAGQLRLSDAMLVGVYKKVMGGKTGEITVAIAQGVIEALKGMQSRLELFDYKKR